MKKAIGIGIILILIAIGLSGCTDSDSQSNDNRFVGTWSCSTEGIESTMILFSDGTVDGIPIYSTVHGTWEIKDNKLVLNVNIFQADTMYSYNYEFSNNDDTLKLKEIDTGKITICNKQ
jgi:hypothetical protein